jgi:hypothetical protein
VGSRGGALRRERDAIALTFILSTNHQAIGMMETWAQKLGLAVTVGKIET